MSSKHIGNNIHDILKELSKLNPEHDLRDFHFYKILDEDFPSSKQLSKVRDFTDMLLEKEISELLNNYNNSEDEKSLEKIDFHGRLTIDSITRELGEVGLTKFTKCKCIYDKESSVACIYGETDMTPKFIIEIFKSIKTIRVSNYQEMLKILDNYRIDRKPVYTGYGVEVYESEINHIQLLYVINDDEQFVRIKIGY